MARTRWGADAPEDTREARRRIIDAAEASFARFGLVKTTVDDIAEAANISRATVYRYFSGARDELVLAVVERQLRQFANDRVRKTSRDSSFADVAVDAVLFTAKAAREQPMLAILWEPEAARLTGAIMGTSQVLHDATREMLRPAFERGKELGTVRQDLDLDRAVEWIIRMVISFASNPSGRSTAEDRRFLQDFLVPALT